MLTWSDYNKKTLGEPRPMAVSAAAYVSAPNPKALDLGCGSGNETRYLLQKGFSVVSVDSNPNVKEFVPNAIISKFEDFVFPKDEFDLVIAMFALPFCAPDKINAVIENIKSSLRHGGVFAGQFFGLEDTWSNRGNMNFQNESEVRAFFEDLEILKLKEVKEERPTALDDPHFWHILHIIARKK